VDIFTYVSPIIRDIPPVAVYYTRNLVAQLLQEEGRSFDHGLTVASLQILIELLSIGKVIYV